MRFLLDTCALSELRKRKPNAGFVAWLDQQPEDWLFVATVTLGELQAGVARLPDADPRKVGLQDWVQRGLSERFGARILAVDTEVALAWGVKRGEAQAAGGPLPAVDGLLAATALVRGLTVVTRNVKDFQRCGAMVLNPWT